MHCACDSLDGDFNLECELKKKQILLILAAAITLGVALTPAAWAAAPVLGGPIPVPLPLFPANNWWNLDITSAPVDLQSGTYIGFINNGPNGRPLHPDFGGEADPGNTNEIYGFPYIIVDGTQVKKTVTFVDSPDESDGVDHNNNDTSFPFYPIPNEAIAQAHWVEEGEPGNVDIRGDSDRHMLIVDKDNNHLYELYNVWYNGTNWEAGSGAFFDMNTNNRRPETWTSADAAGLAILPGLVRYEEAFGAGEINHAFRMTVRTTNGYVYPASHVAGTTAGALPMGARLRLKGNTNISSYTPEVQRIFRAMMKYGLIVADNGSDMYISGTFDTRWDNGILNPAFGALTANDFDVIQLGYAPVVPTISNVSPSSGPQAGGTSVTISGTDFAAGAVVKFGTVTAASPVISSGSIQVASPAHAPGVVAVSVTNPSGQSATKSSAFTFISTVTPRGDCNGDGTVNPPDIFYLINRLFSGGPAPFGSGDANSDNSVSPADIFFLINYLFAGGPAPGP